jgi:hypothetical protein
MNSINTAAQMVHLSHVISVFKFNAEFADGLCYNNPIMGKFNEDTPEVIITIEDDGHQAYKHVLANGIHCIQRGVNRYVGNTFYNGTNIDIHVKIAEDWELHHDASKLTGLKFKLA